MLKNSPQGLSKAIVSMVLSLTLLISCSKSYDPANLVNDKVALLTGQPDSVNWVLNTVQVNNSIDTASKGAVKIYRADGSFVDNVGFTGFWTMFSRDSLIESSHPCVNPNAPYTTTHFHIDRLEKGRLQLTYTDADKKIKLVYDANK